jgi:hypothetical protein
MKLLDLGIDKVQCKIDLPSNVIAPNFNTNEGWSKSVKGAFIEGEYIPHRFGYYSKEMEGLNGNLTMELDTMSQSLSLLFNPTNCHSEYKLTLDINQSIDTIQSLVVNAGIDVDIREAKLQRLDIAKDKVLKENPSIYASHLSNFVSFKRQATKREYEDGHILGNQSKQFGYYNRQLHLDNKRIQHDLENNTARLEYRLLNKGARNWRETYSIHKLSDLTNEYEQYKDIYRDGMSNLIKVNEDKIVYLAMDLQSQLELIKRKGYRNGVSLLANMVGWHNLIDMYGIETLVMTFSEVYNTQPKVVRSRLKQEIERMRSIYTLKSEYRQPLDYVNEILTKYAS